MAENSKIEWTNHTLNLWWGCTKVRNNPLCDNCYANAWANRMGNDVWGDDKPRRVIKDVWGKLDLWQKKAEAQGVKAKVFTMSMGDIFERSKMLVNHKGENVSGTTGQLREKLFKNISNGEYPDLIFQMLTKRPQNVKRMVPDSWLEEWPENVWLGTSVGDQENADRNIPALLEVPVKKRFLSMEPLLGKVNLEQYITNISWVIVGGESGGGARPMNEEWALRIKQQCHVARVPFFFKQWGKHNASGNPVGKNNAGALLTGQHYREFPS